MLACAFVRNDRVQFVNQVGASALQKFAENFMIGCKTERAEGETEGYKRRQAFYGQLKTVV